jgi:DNA-binding CsgD family transcriptional regulator
MRPFDVAFVADALAEAAIAPEQWTASLARVSEHTGSAGAIMLPVVGDLPIIVGTSLEESCDFYVNQGWRQRDERYRPMKTFMATGVVTDDDVMAPELRRHSPFYQEFLTKFHLKGWAGVRVGQGSLVWNLSMQRTSSQDVYSDAELNCFADLSSRLDSVSQVSMALDFAKGQAALDAFQYSKRPAMLFNRSGLVVRANGAAEELLGENIQLRQGRLRSWDTSATEMLDRTLSELFWKPNVSIPKPVVFRKLDGGKFVFYAMRIPSATQSPLAAFHAIMVIGETGTKRTFSPSTLRAIFGLTAAEAKLAGAIGCGEDVSGYASRVGLSQSTVRNQLKSVFAKVGVSRQADLVATLSGLLPDGS